MDKNILENPNFLSYSNILLPNNSVEFAVVAINECFINESSKNITITDKPYSEEIHKYYLNNLILSDTDLNEESRYVIKFEDDKNHKYSFDNLKNDKNLSKEFCSKFEKYFKQKFGNQYDLEILTIKKGSRELIIRSNIPENIFNDFVKYLNDHAEDDIGAANEVKLEKNIRELKFSADMIDTRGNFDFTNYGETQKRGGLDYYQPKGWIGIGLKVSKRFDNGNDNWLAMDGNPNEWAVGFHGFKKINIGLLPIVGNVISKPNWAHGCKDHPNLNEKTKGKYPKCGFGVYFGDKIDVCHNNGFTGTCKIGSVNISLAFQCRINPEEIRTTNYSPSKAYVVPNQSNDDYSKIRPYRILLLKS